jgi:hypothetical protein
MGRTKQYCVSNVNTLTKNEKLFNGGIKDNWKLEKKKIEVLTLSNQRK